MTKQAMLERAKRLTRFSESTSAKVDRVDRVAGVIYGVQVLGSVSKNDGGSRRYSEKSQHSAASLYEGVAVGIDHRDGNASPTLGLTEEFGVLRGNRVENGRVVADLHYLKSHPACEMILERIDRGFPIGLSHDAEGPVARSGGEVIVEDITHVYRVDLVRNPATNSTLFESVTTKEAKPMARKIKDLLEACASKDARAKRLLEMEDDPMAPMMDAEMPVETVAEEPDPSQEVDAALASLVMAVLAEKLPVEETIAKIGAVLRAAMGEASAESDGSGDAAVSEAVQEIRKQLFATNRSLAIREACEEHGITVASLGKDRVQLARDASSDESARKLIESWVPSIRVETKPQGVSAKRLKESQSEESYEASKRKWFS